MALLSLLVAGCGGDDDADAQQIDKAAFVKEARQICEQASGKLAAKTTQISTRESEKPNYDFKKGQITLIEDALIPSLEEELGQLRELGIPKEAKKDAETFLNTYQEAIDEMKAKPNTGLETPAPYEEIELVGRKFGVAECPIANVTAG